MRQSVKYSIYPLFYIYVRTLTDERFRKALFLFLIPGVLAGLISAASILCGGDFALIKKIAAVVFTIEVAYTGIFGILGLIRYRRRIANFYADIEEISLMEKREYSLSEIADLSGYIDGNAFYKAFTKIQGKSPSA